MHVPLATNASLNAPTGVRVDGLGNLYIADYNNARVRKVDTNGIITTVAGNGLAGYSGDGNAATNADVNGPFDVAVDASGNLFIAENYINRIRRVDTNGIISTIAGSGYVGPPGSYSGDGGQATNATLDIPNGVAVDSVGQVYIADSGDNRIRKVATNGIISTVAGNGNRTFAGDGGAATNASISFPTEAALDAAGDHLFIADSSNGRIRGVAFALDPQPVFELDNVTTNNSGNYSVVITSPYGSVTSAVVGLTVISPAITVQPANLVVLAGTNVNLSATAVGSAPLYYSWYFNSTNLLHSGADAALALLGVTVTNTGNYSVVVTNAYGSVTSEPTALTVAPLAITSQPASQPVWPGSNATLNVTATSIAPLLSYSWYFDVTNLLQTGPGSELVVSDVGATSVGSYTVVISNSYGSVTSQVAALTLATQPSVTAQPTNQTVLAGSNVALSVGVAGTGPLTYQWLFNGTNLLPLISTVAGNGSQGYSGNRGAAISAELYHPFDVAFDADGNLYVADESNDCIRKIDTNGTITTVAGNASSGYSGDGGWATNAMLASPTAVALDASGNLYIADSGNNRIRLVGTNGVIATFAGNGVGQFAGDDGAATNASLNSPQGIAFDALGNLYITDNDNNRIRIVGSNGIIATLVGNGSASFSGDGGPATNAALNGPSGVALDAMGDLYFSDYGNQRIREVATNGVISTIAGGGNAPFSGDGGAATGAALDGPEGVVFDTSGNLYIADSANNRIRMVAANGIISTVAGNGTTAYSGDGEPAAEAGLDDPYGVVFDAAGNLYIADLAENRVRKLAFAWSPTLMLSAVSSNNAGNYYLLATSPYGSVTSAVVSLTVGYPPTNLFQPANQAVGPGSNAAFNVTSSGTPPLYYSWYFEVTNLLQTGTNSMLVISNVSLANAGEYEVVTTNTYGAATSSEASLDNPSGVTLDDFGDLYIADTDNNCVREVGTNGIITTLAGNGTAGYSGDSGQATNATLNSPFGVAADAFGDLYIADSSNNVIRRLDTNGFISTAAGNGTNGYSGDGGPATNAMLNRPRGVTLDALGNLYIADANNERIRKVLLSAANPTFTINNVSVTNVGNYSLVVTSPFGTATSAVTTLTVQAPPVITLQPTNQIAVAGNNTSFSVAAIGSGPFEYLWYFDATNLVEVETNSTLSLADISTNQAGNYTVVVTNTYGASTSLVATLTVGFAPSVSVQPSHQTIIAGNSVTFNVTAAGGGPYTYQWQFNGTNLPKNIINTVAGGGIDSIGDGGPANMSSLYKPYGVGLDAAGNLYIADTYEYRIRKVGTNDIITTVAGDGAGPPGVFGTYSGDGGAATNAGLNFPHGVTADFAGNLFIADTQNNRVRKVNTNGIISTVAGTGAPYFTADGGAATSAGVYAPGGVAVDAVGNFYIADTDNDRIRKVNTNGIISTVAGDGYQSYSGDGGAATSAALYHPQKITFDASSNLFIADAGNNRVRKVGTNGIITTVAGKGTASYSGDGGSATNATLNSPSDLALDSIGNLYIADAGNNRIRVVGTNGIITTLAGTGNAGYAGDGGAATNAVLNNPNGLVMGSSNNLYIADSGNERIRAVSLSGFSSFAVNNPGAKNAGNYDVVITSPYGSVTSMVAALSVLLPPSVVTQPTSQWVLNGSNVTLSVTVSGTPPFSYAWFENATNVIPNATNSTLTVQDFTTTNAGNYTVVVTNAYGTATSQAAILTLVYPPSVATQPTNLTILAGSLASFGVTAGGTGPLAYQWQFDGTNLPNWIATVAGNGSAPYAGDGGVAISASLDLPCGVLSDAFGKLYIADTYDQRIREVDTNGIITTVAGNGTSAFSGDGGWATNASLSYPQALALDAFGNLYIADDSNQRIRKVDTNGIITTVAGNGVAAYSGDGGVATNATLNGPSGLALDAVGNLYFSDYGNERIREVDTNGVITTVAGNGTGGYSGDGGAATNAELNGPEGVVLDVAGNLYIADLSNNRIRKVGTNGIITTVAGNGVSSYSGDGGAATNASLHSPCGLDTSNSGYLYIADRFNNRIRMVDPNGIITTVAGDGSVGYSGDGGVATSTELNGPFGVTSDGRGNLYIADTGNHRIRYALLEAAYPTLTLPDSVTNNAGNYTLAITSPYGSVTSAVISLNIILSPPQIMTSDGFFGFMTNQFGFNLSGETNQTIVVDGSTDLVIWDPLFTNTVNSNPFYFYDPAWTNFPQRFYRARVP